MLPIIASMLFLVAPDIHGATSETSVRARATEARVVEVDAPRGEIISEAPSQTPARSLRELMRVRLVLPDGVLSESSAPTVAMGPRAMHASSPGDLGPAIP